MYSRIISTEAPSFFMTTFSASVTKLTTLLSQSHDCSCYVSRRVLAPPPLWLQEHNYIRAHDLAHAPGFDIGLGCLTLLAPEAGDFVELLLFYKITINDLEILILCYSEQVEGAVQVYTTTSTHDSYLPPSLQSAARFRR
jgi:hypothetical protein